MKVARRVLSLWTGDVQGLDRAAAGSLGNGEADPASWTNIELQGWWSSLKYDVQGNQDRHCKAWVSTTSARLHKYS